jgi:hypothetical protein
MLIIFFDIKEIVHKEFVLAAQTVNSSYYCNMKMCEDFAPDFGNKKLAVVSRQRIVPHFIFTRKFLIKNSMAIVFQPS